MNLTVVWKKSVKVEKDSENVFCLWCVRGITPTVGSVCIYPDIQPGQRLLALQSTQHFVRCRTVK